MRLRRFLRAGTFSRPHTTMLRYRSAFYTRWCRTGAITASGRRTAHSR